jgi:hypothetical protein
VIRQATFKALIESKLEMDKSNLKKDFLEFVPYMGEIAIIHDELGHVVDHIKKVTLARRTRAKEVTLVAKVLDTTLEEAPLEVPAARRLTVIERSSVMEGHRTRVALATSLQVYKRAFTLS